MCAFICRLYALGVIIIDIVAKVLKCKENTLHFASNLRGYCRQVMNLGENSRLSQRTKLRALSPSRLGDSLWSCKLRGSSLLLSLSPSFSLSPPLSLSHSAAAPLAPQLSRSTALSHIYTHTFSARTYTHTYAHTSTASCGIPYGAAAFPTAYQVRPRREMGGAAPGSQNTLRGLVQSCWSGMLLEVRCCFFLPCRNRF